MTNLRVKDRTAVFSKDCQLSLLAVSIELYRRPKKRSNVTTWPNKSARLKSINNIEILKLIIKILTKTVWKNSFFICKIQTNMILFITMSTL